MAIKKENIQDLVEIFYQAPFKVFYINSTDGDSFTKPFALFVSLGITTPMETISQVKDCLQRVEGGAYNTKVVELKSSSISGQYLNSVNQENPETQYEVTSFPEEFWDEASSKELLNSYDPESEEYERLEKLIGKLNSDGWGNDVIYFTKNEFRVFHSKVNYKREGLDEFRIGIYVEEKS